MIKKIYFIFILGFFISDVFAMMRLEDLSQEDKFSANLRSLQAKYPDFIKIRGNIESESEIYDFIEENKRLGMIFLAKKTDLFIEEEKIKFKIFNGPYQQDSFDLDSQKNIFKENIKKRCFKDVDISFLNNITDGKWEEGKGGVKNFKGSWVSLNYFKMMQKVDKLFEECIPIVIPQITHIVTPKPASLHFLDLKVEIPEDSVSNDEQIEFSARQLPESHFIIKNSKIPEQSKRLSDVYEISPHKKKFNKKIELSFTQKIKNKNKNYGLFIQKHFEQSKDLDEWRVVLDYDQSKEYPTFYLDNFSFVFLGELDKEIPVTLKDDPDFLSTPKHLWIKPGLNYSVSCYKPDCPGAKGMVIERGFREEIRPNEEIDNGEIICTFCNTEISDSQNIKKIILFNAQGDIKYKLKKEKGSILKHSFNTGSKSLCLYGAEKHIDEYSTIIFNVKNLLANPQEEREAIKEKMVARLIDIDNGGNPLGSIYDLGKDDFFGDVKLLVGHFYEPAWGSHVEEALAQKGFQLKRTTNEKEFLQELPKHDVAWIIDYYSDEKSFIKDPSFVEQVIKYINSGKNLLLWEDDNSEKATRETHVTSILKKMFNFTVEGIDSGNKILEQGNGLKYQTFDQNHDIFKGIYKLYEGWTICHPDKQDVSPFKVIATSSAGRPNIMAMERDKTKGRIVLDCANTRLFKDWWDKPGTGRYVRNVVCWLAGASCEE